MAANEQIFAFIISLCSWPASQKALRDQRGSSMGIKGRSLARVAGQLGQGQAREQTVISLIKRLPSIHGIHAKIKPAARFFSSKGFKFNDHTNVGGCNATKTAASFVGLFAWPADSLSVQ